MKAAQAVSRFRASPLHRFNTGCLEISSKLQVRHSASLLNPQFQLLAPVAVKIRNLGLGPTSKDFEDAPQPQFTSPLTKVHAEELVLHLNDEERKVMLHALQHYESKRIKEDFEGKSFGLIVTLPCINCNIGFATSDSHFQIR